MEQLHVKTVNQYTNRLRFSGIKQRELATTADVYRRAKQGDQIRVHSNGGTKVANDENPDTVPAGFQSEMDHLHEKNATEEYHHFYSKCWSLSRSLPEILHYRKKIVSLIISSAEAEDCTTQTRIDLLHLLGVLARDLRSDLVEAAPKCVEKKESICFHPLIRKLLNLVDPLNPSITESVFQTLSYLFMYCIPSDNTYCTADEMRQYYGTFLGHKKDFVRRLAAEAFSSLFRKCKKAKAKRNHVRNVTRAFAAAVGSDHQTIASRDVKNMIDGIARYFFYTLKGIPGKLHSRGHEILYAITECLTDQEKIVRNLLQLRVVESVVSAVIEYVCLHVDTESYSLVWSNLFQVIHISQNDLIRSREEIAKDDSARKMMEEKIKATIRTVMSSIIKRNETNMHENSSQDETLMLSKTLRNLLEASFYTDLPDDCQSTILDFLSVAWKYYGSQSIFSSSLASLISNTVVNSNSIIAVTKLANNLLPLLSRPVAMQSLAPSLLTAAAKQGSENFASAIILVHAVASLGDDSKDQDDILYIENAKQCASIDEDLSKLIKICLDKEGVDTSLATFIARCLPFLVIASRSSLRDNYEELALKWIQYQLEQTKQHLNETITDEGCVAVGIFLESFSLLCYDSLLNRPDSKHNKVKKILKKVREVVESVTLICHHSSYVMKGIASYVKVLQLSSLNFTENIDKMFEVLVPNLRSPNHFLRFHTLTILESFPVKPYIVDHSDVDFYDDLDEEPSKSHPVGVQMPVFSGPCPMIKHLLALESAPISFHNERQFLSELNRIEVLGRSGKIPIEYAEAAANLMLGVFHVKFSSIWSAAKKVLVALSENYEELVWLPLRFYVKDLMKIEGKCDTCVVQSVLNSPSDFIEDLFAKTISWETSRGRDVALFEGRLIHAKQHGQISYHQRTDLSTVFRVVWDVLSMIPSLISKKSRDFVPIFLAFLNEQYYVAYPEDLDARELELSEFTTDLGPLKIGRGVSQRRLVSFLKVFAAINGPQQLYRNSLLQRIFIALLANPDANIAQASFDCLMKFKLPHIVPYCEQMRKLLTKSELREAMTKFDISMEKSIVDKEHRQQLIPIITRILFGRLAARQSGKKSLKDSPESKRAAVLSFLSSVDTSKGELNALIYMMVRAFIPPSVFQSSEKYCSESKWFASMISKASLITVSDITSVLPQRRLGFINLVSSAVTQLGLDLFQYVPSIMSLLLSLLEYHELNRQKLTEFNSLNEDGEDSGTDDESKFAPKNDGRNLRTLCSLVLSKMFSKFALTFDFLPYSERLWRVLSNALIKLPDMVINANKPPSLLKMLEILSSHPRLIPLVTDDAVVAAALCITESSKANIVECAMNIFEGLLTEGKSVLREEDRIGTEKGVQIIQRNLTLIIDRFADRFGAKNDINDGSDGKYGENIMVPTTGKELDILCRISELLVSQQQNVDIIPPNRADKLGSLCKLLIPFLNTTRKTSDESKINVLGIVKCFIPMMNQEQALTLVPLLARLLGPTKSRMGLSNPHIRSLIVAVIASIAEREGQTSTLVGVSKALIGLNSMNKKRLDEYDFDALLPVLTSLGNNESGSWLDLAQRSNNNHADVKTLLPLLLNCFHSLYDSDGVVSRGAFKALKTFIYIAKEDCDRFADHTKSPWYIMIESTFVNYLKIGLSTKTDNVRRSYILLLSEVSRAFQAYESPHLYGDLFILIRDDDVEQDFFLNITHLQIHRRAKALTRLRKLLNDEDPTNVNKECPFTLQSLANILLPLATHPIYESTKSVEESFALEAVATIGAITRHLTWSRYQSSIWNLLLQLPRYPDQERYMIGALCAMLDSFHFDTESIIKTDDDMVNEAKTDDTDDRTSNVVWRALTKRIIPKVEQYLVKQQVDKSGSHFNSIRPPIALALLKLFQKLPSETFNLKLPNLLLTICGVLKSKDSDARDAARKTLSKMIVTLGVDYLPHILRELSVTLTEGYQLHVRSATLHSILLSVSSLNSSILAMPSFERSVPAIMDLIQEDLFGVASEMKSAESTRKSHIKEAMGVKSYDSLEILSRLVLFRPSLMREWNGSGTPPSSIHIIIQPLLERLRQPNIDKVTVGKIKECLSKVVIGLSKNQSVVVSEILPFVHATTSPLFQSPADNSESWSDRDDSDESVGGIEVSSGTNKTKKKSNKRKELKPSVSTWSPSTKETVKDAKGARLLKQQQHKELKRVLDGENAPKLTGSFRHGISAVSKETQNDPAHSSVIIFGLSLLYSSLKKNKLDWNDSSVRAMVAPLVTILTRCIGSSSENESILLSLRCLQFFLRWDLPVIENSVKILGPSILNTLTIFGSDPSNELTQGCFKTLSFLLSYDKSENAKDKVAEKKGKIQKKLPLKSHQMQALVSLLHGAITDVTPHSSSLNLIRAIVSQNYLSPELYDMMELVLKLNVQSQVETVRKSCGNIFVYFFVNYPLSEKRRKQHLQQMLSNLKYEYESGRLSVIELIANIMQKLPINLVEEYSHISFLPLVLQLVNEDSKKCKERIAFCIGVILSRVSIERLNSFYQYMIRWFNEGSDNEKLILQRIAAQLIGLLIDNRREFFKSEAIASLMDNIESKIQREIKEESTTVLNDGRWELLYFCLICIEKLFDGNKPSSICHYMIWNVIIKTLIHPHPWVQQTSTRMINNLLLGFDPSTFADSSGKHLFIIDRKGSLYDIARNLCHQLNSSEDEQNENLTNISIKSLTWVFQAMHHYPGLCFNEGESYAMDSDTEEGNKREYSNPTHWLFKRLSNIAKNKGTQRRTAVFKCFAAFASVCQSELLVDHLPLILEPLHRALTESENEENAKTRKMGEEEVVDMIKETLQLFENRCGTEDFIKAFAIVKIRAAEKRNKRKLEINTEAVSNPQAAAERKIKKQEANKRRKKRRIDERKASRGSFKKRKGSMMA